MVKRKSKRWLWCAVELFLCWIFVPQVWITGLNLNGQAQMAEIHGSVVFSGDARYELERTGSGWNVQGLALQDVNNMYLEINATDSAASEEIQLKIDGLSLRTTYGAWDILEFKDQCALENPWNVGTWEKCGQSYRYTAQGTNVMLVLNDAVTRRLQRLFFAFVFV